ncbi:MAG: alanine racemase [Clostridiales bacterium]|nr:alanine racemase [Clostridiales bacterium]
MKFEKKKIVEIKNLFGLPCYVFDEVAFRENYQKLRKALSDVYSHYKIAYSYKTNYAPKICSIVKEMDGFAEVVSDMEYDIAKFIGYENKKVVYNGPFKGPKLEEHLLNGGILNIDNLNEIDRVITFAEKHKKVFKVGIRANINIGQKYISRFGIDSESEDFTEAVRRLSQCNYTRLVGLHCHIGQSRSIDAWKSRTDHILKLADKYIEAVPEYIDLGSGMFGDMEPSMREQFNIDIPSYEDYAKVTASIVADHYKDIPENSKPILFTEPGTTVDNRYIDLIAEVNSIKKVKGKDFAVLNCSIHNLGDVSGSVKLPIDVIQNSDSRDKYSDIDWVGYTCLEKDVTYKGYSGNLGQGDYVVFGNVGGYSNVDKPPFILPQCAMIGLSESEMYIIKRKETTEDILSTYIV